MLKQSCFLCKLVGIFAIIGALNLGILGVSGYNVIEHLLGFGSVATRVLYGVIGLSGLALLSSFFTCCSCCSCCSCGCKKDKDCCCKKDKDCYSKNDRDYNSKNDKDNV